MVATNGDPFKEIKRQFLHQTTHFCCGAAFLLHDNGMLVPLKPQTFRDLLSSRVNWQTTKPVTAVTMLMQMLAQVNAFHHYRTLSKHFVVHQKQVEYDDGLLR